MKFEQTQQYIMAKPEVIETYPFGSESCVYKIKHKMFATLSIEKESKHYWLNLKCEPEEALELRDKYPSILPGHHMNKKHWNTIILDGSIPDEEVQRQIDNSFMIVVSGMPDESRKAIEEQLAIQH